LSPRAGLPSRARQTLRKSVMTEYPRFNITGEVWYDNPAIVSYWQRGKKNPNGNSSHLPSLFDFPLHYAMVKALMTDETWDSGWLYLYEMLAQDFQYPDPQQLVVFADNHDMARIYNQLDKNIAKLQMALSYVLTIRGIPQIYYGTEVLMESPKDRDDGLVRSDFPGGWPGDKTNAFNGFGLDKNQKEMQSFLKRILHWRKNATAIHSGQTIHFVPRDGVYVFFRIDAEQKVLIILNKNENTIRLDLDRFRRIIGDSATGFEVISGTNIELTSPISLDHPGPMIIEIK
jgi:glycosidase